VFGAAFHEIPAALEASGLLNGVSMEPLPEFGVSATLLAKLDSVWAQLEIPALARIEGAAKYSRFSSSGVVCVCVCDSGVPVSSLWLGVMRCL
jgi:hypothetical protein